MPHKEKLLDKEPLLSDRAFKFYIETVWIVWIIILVFIYIKQFNLQINRDILTSIAAASVDVAALSIAVIGILEGVNKVDRWLKLALFFVATLFGLVVLSGFWLVLTWVPEFEVPRKIAVVFIGVIGFAAFVQVSFDWAPNILINIYNLLSRFNLKLELLWEYMFFTIFLFPICIFITGEDSIASTLVIFIGSLVALFVLMLFLVWIFITRLGPSLDDAVRTMGDIETMQKLSTHLARQPISSILLNLILGLQNDRTLQATTSPAKMIRLEDITNRLRQRQVVESPEIAKRSLQILIDEGKLFHTNDKYWIVDQGFLRDKGEANIAAKAIHELAFICTHKPSEEIEEVLIVEGYKFDELAKTITLAHKKIPLEIVREFVIPLTSQILNDKRIFRRQSANFDTFFVNLHWQLADIAWSSIFWNSIMLSSQLWISRYADRSEPLSSYKQDIVSIITKKQDFLVALEPFIEELLRDEFFLTSFYMAIMREIPHSYDGKENTNYAKFELLSFVEIENILHILHIPIDRFLDVLKLSANEDR